MRQNCSHREEAKFPDINAKRVAGEVLSMLLMPQSIVPLTSESELGGNFEVSMHCHTTTGELSFRPGFRMMELHRLYLDYINDGTMYF